MKRTRLASIILATSLAGGGALMGTALAAPAQASTCGTTVVAGCGGFTSSCGFGGIGFGDFGFAGFGDFGLTGFDGFCSGFGF
jgi:hypothetical protein